MITNLIKNKIVRKAVFYVIGAIIVTIPGGKLLKDYLLPVLDIIIENVDKR